MYSSVAISPRRIAGASVTTHARRRMVDRNISDRAIEAVLDFGRISRVRGAEIYSVGRKEVRLYAREGIDLEACEGVHVVCSPNGTVLTAYRNSNFRGLRPGR